MGLNLGDCSSDVINPTYPGREDVAGPVDKLKTECTKTITLEYDNNQNLVELRESTHTVSKDRFCLITINNLSGVK